MRLELRDAFVGRAEDGAVLGGIAPAGEIPLGGEPFHHRGLDVLARPADVDRELVETHQPVGVLAGALGEAADLVPGADEALGGIVIGEPAIAGDGGALEHAVDIAADQDRRARRLHRLGRHHRLAQLIGRVGRGDRILLPEAGQDLQIPVHHVAPLVERHADGVELALVPAGRHAQGEASAGDMVDARELLGQHHRVARRQDEDAGAQADPAGARRDRGQHRQRIEDRETGIDPEQDMVPYPDRLVSQLLHTHPELDQTLRVRHLRIRGEVLHGDADSACVLRHLDRLPFSVRISAPRQAM